MCRAKPSGQPLGACHTRDFRIPESGIPDPGIRDPSSTASRVTTTSWHAGKARREGGGTGVAMSGGARRAARRTWSSPPAQDDSMFKSPANGSK